MARPDRFGRIKQRGLGPSKKEINIYNCNNRDYTECYYFLQNLIGDHPYRQVFDTWFSNMSTETYDDVQSKNINQVNFGDLMQEENETFGEWGWFCSCSFHGFGGCGGGDWCCGAGGLGIGCRYKEKKPGSKGSVN